MSGLPLGAPVQRRQSFTPTTRVFDHIPRLREVLAHGGWPGAIYAQVCIHNLKAAKERTERPARLDELQGGQVYYTITGPKGRAEVALVGTGEVIPGASPEAGNRLFFTDGEIGKLTGLPVQYPIWLRPQEDEHEPRRREVAQPARDDRAGEGQEGDGRVRPRQPAQRKRERTDRPFTEAGSRDRAQRRQEVSEKELARRKAASERMKAMHAARRQGA